MLNERSDVYSFGILLMEIITGRNPVDYSRPPGEVCNDLLKITCYIGDLFKFAFYFVINIAILILR